MLKTFKKTLICTIYVSISILTSGFCQTTDSIVYPIKLTPLLSGNFGELRATHFHSGIDFKTQGVEGFPVVSVMDGVISRVRVSPTGYGKALYVEHPNGLTTVYGHLSRFNSKIDAIVKELQYKNESFSINEDLTSYELVFNAGDTIAYSGNTGSSMGPHLHFEIRNTLTENTLNPLKYLSVKDNSAPNIRGLYIYTFFEEGVLDECKRIELKKTGNRTFSGGQINLPEGKTGIGIHADDFMQDSWNKLGVYKINLYADNNIIFNMQMDEISYSESYLINELKDFHLYNKGEYVYKTFGEFQNKILSVSNKNGGYIDLQKEQPVKIKIDLSDIYNNMSTIELELVATQTANELQIPERSRLIDNRSHEIYLDNFTMKLSDNSLSNPIIINPIRKNEHIDSLWYFDIYTISDKIYPLLKNAEISFKGEFQEKTIICTINDKKRLTALKTIVKDSSLIAETKIIGSYTIQQDTVAPQIFYIGHKGNNKIAFTIFDDLSGIGSYSVEVNEQWCLFEYDAKNKLIEVNLNEKPFVKGENSVIIEVVDNVGNIATFQTKVNKK